MIRLRILAGGGLLVLALGCGRDERPTMAAPVPAPSAAPSAVAPPSTAATAEPAAPAASARVTDATFELSLVPSGEYRAGQAGQVRVVLEARAPYKVNEEYPYKFKLEPSAGLQYTADTVGRDAVKLEKTRATMTVGLTPRAAGRQQVAGKFLFSVCTEQKCLVEKRDLALTIEVR